MKVTLFSLSIAVIVFLLNSLLSSHPCLAMARRKVLRKQENPSSKKSNRGKHYIAPILGDDSSTSSEECNTPTTNQDNIPSLLKGINPAVFDEVEAFFRNRGGIPPVIPAPSVENENVVATPPLAPPLDSNSDMNAKVDTPLDPSNPRALVAARAEMMDENQGLLGTFGPGGVDSSIVRRVKFTPDYVRKQNKMIGLVN